VVRYMIYFELGSPLISNRLADPDSGSLTFNSSLIHPMWVRHPCFFYIIIMWWRLNNGFLFADDRRWNDRYRLPPSPSLSLSLPLWLGSHARDLDPTTRKGWARPFLFHLFSPASMTARILSVSMPLFFVQVLIVWQYRTHVLS